MSESADLILDQKTFDKNQIRKGAIDFYNLEIAIEKYKTDL